MDFDTLIYAVVAVLLLGRLWTILGRRNDDDPQRPNPFIRPAPDVTDKPEAAPRLLADGTNAPQPPKPVLLAAPASLAGGLQQVQILDPTFNERSFLQGARTAFSMIVEDFAKGDMSRISKLLGPSVLPHFQAALTARQAAGETLESRVKIIREAEVLTARADSSVAYVTVRFVSEQENVHKDNTGRLLSGAPGSLEEITDVWTFSRDTSARDPNWILTETRS